MNAWDAAKFISKFENKELAEEVVKILGNLTIPGQERLFPAGYDTPTDNLLKQLKNEFDFKLGDTITNDVILRHGAARANMTELMNHHDLDLGKVMEARALVGYQSEGPMGLALGTGAVLRSQSKDAKAPQTAGGQSLFTNHDLQLMVSSAIEAALTASPRNKSRDRSSRRGEARDGRYSSRERTRIYSEARPTSRSEARGRPLPSGHDSWAPRGTQRYDYSTSCSRRRASRSPRRTYGGHQYPSEDSRGRSSSRGARYGPSRPSSGELRAYYPEMDDGVNCRLGYNPYKEKHCTKCSRVAQEHHEFLCRKYDLYCQRICSTCYKGNHFPKECRDRVKAFPPQVAGESHPRTQSKNLVLPLESITH